MVRGFICRLPLFSVGGMVRAHPDRLSHWCWTRKFQTGWVRLHLWEWLKQQLGQVLNLLLESWALAQVTPLGASGFFFNNCYLLTKPLKLNSAEASVRSLPGASQGLTTPSEVWAKPLQCHLRVCEKCGRSRPSLDWARICSLMRSQCDLCAHQS